MQTDSPSESCVSLIILTSVNFSCCMSLRSPICYVERLIVIHGLVGWRLENLFKVKCLFVCFPLAFLIGTVVTQWEPSFAFTYGLCDCKQTADKDVQTSGARFQGFVDIIMQLERLRWEWLGKLSFIYISSMCNVSIASLWWKFLSRWTIRQ